jgi:hypothetical protein
MRLYALYLLDKKILAVMLVSFAIANAAAGYVMGIALAVMQRAFSFLISGSAWTSSHAFSILSGTSSMADPSSRLRTSQHPRLFLDVLGADYHHGESSVRAGSISRCYDIHERRGVVPIGKEDSGNFDQRFSVLLSCVRFLVLYLFRQHFLTSVCQHVLCLPHVSSHLVSSSCTSSPSLTPFTPLIHTFPLAKSARSPHPVLCCILLRNCKSSDH